ncbi:hypothetical protein BN1051_00415 [Arthrobacter saudimassiliensis]|uniref:Uncharacterized protein n=1 Tax=Arthrobacter saudimassiliensis TaxID=1461584 RepID=A0A078MNZ4_9MICC|nr:hypothetical protein BN1051_00415 [Arthrobacter saudimassiliensis]
MEYVEVLLPSVAVGVLFFFAMKALLNADRSERKAQAEADAEARTEGPEDGESKSDKTAG